LILDLLRRVKSVFEKLEKLQPICFWISISSDSLIELFKNRYVVSLHFDVLISMLGVNKIEL
jgi:hypothetical protein